MPKIRKSVVFCHGIWADGSCFIQQGNPRASGRRSRGDGRPIRPRDSRRRCRHGKADAREGQPPQPSSSATLTVEGSSRPQEPMTGSLDSSTSPRLRPILMKPRRQQAKFPVTDVFEYIEVTDGRLWLRPEGVACFAGEPIGARAKGPCNSGGVQSGTPTRFRASTSAASSSR
jgi:hypothetical protein